MSKGTFGYIIAFSLGATAGAVVAWKLLENKYEQLVQNEIKELRERFASRSTDEETAPAEEVEEEPDTTDAAYEEIISSNGYIKYGDIKTPDEGSNVFGEQPYVISPESFGMKRDYDTVSLIYYTDGILANTSDEIIEDVEETVGDALESFGEYEDDAVHVRNDMMQTDFEILASMKRYSDVISTVVPPDVED